jgi:hypothetical protein
LSINLQNYIPRFLHSTPWNSFCSVISQSLNEVYDEYLEAWFNTVKKEVATLDDFVEIILSLGYPLNLNYIYNNNYIKKMALTITERIRLKTTPTAYERLFYSLSIMGYVYPLVEQNNALIPLLTYDEITDISEYLGSSYLEDTFELTKHMDIRIEPKYVAEWNTSYYFTKPKHHYKLDDTSGTLVIDYGTYPSNATHNLDASRLGQASIIDGTTCYLFNGISDRIDSNYYSINKNKTICFWAKKNSNDPNKIIFGSEDSILNKFYLGFQSTGYMGAGVGAGEWNNQFDILSIIPTWNPIDWHWYCITFNTGLGKTILYIDNQYIGYILTNNRTSQVDYYIACLNNNGVDTYFFDGYISDFRIYEYIVVEETREDIYNDGNGRIDNVLKTGNIGQFLDENTLKITQYEVEKIKMLEEVPHFSSYLPLTCNETGDVCTSYVYDIDGNIFENNSIKTVVTYNWLKISGIAFDTINPETGSYYAFDEIIAWKWDTTKDGWLNNITTIVLGQGYQVEVLSSASELQAQIYEHTILDEEKTETYTGGINNTGQYILDIDVGSPPGVYWVTEIGLYNSSGLLVFYASVPRLNRIDDYRFKFNITIDKD